MIWFHKIPTAKGYSIVVTNAEYRYIMKSINESLKLIIAQHWNQLKNYL